MEATLIYSAVSNHYTDAAQNAHRDHSERIAKQFGYSKDELESIPQDANLGLSCGNPHALANLREGETVIDLGSGAGLDVFLAAKKVGHQGRAIGVDSNKEMLKKAHGILAKTSAPNVSFVESKITEVSLPDQIADCIISNCVINLVPESEKQRVFDETFRLLRPGGRLAISDVLLKKDLPPEARRSMELYVGCIAGASQITSYDTYLRAAGFREILIVDDQVDLNVSEGSEAYGFASFCSPSSGKCCGSSAKKDSSGSKSSCGPPKAHAVQKFDFNEFAGSFKIFAVKQ